jgi:hypothetical protein
MSAIQARFTANTAPRFGNLDPNEPKIDRTVAIQNFNALQAIMAKSLSEAREAMDDLNTRRANSTNPSAPCRSLAEFLRGNEYHRNTLTTLGTASAGTGIKIDSLM